MILRRWELTVLMLMNNREAMALDGSPSAMSGRISFSLKEKPGPGHFLKVTVLDQVTGGTGSKHALYKLPGGVRGKGDYPDDGFGFRIYQPWGFYPIRCKGVNSS